MINKLRPYQEQAIVDICKAWETNKKVCFQAPTGSGKTLIALEIIKNAGTSTLFVVHRKELVRQVAKILQEHDFDFGYIASGYDYVPGKQVYICMVQTLAARKADLPHFDLTIIDEAHHASTASYDKCINGSYLLGLTATPRRMDNKGLGSRFDVLVPGPPIEDLIKDGYLAVPEIYVPPKTARLVDANRQDWKVTAGDYNKKAIDQFFIDNQKIIFGDVIEHYKQLANDKPTIVFCPSVQSVYETVRLFNSNGVGANGIDGSMTDQEREVIIDELRTGYSPVLVSCDLVSEGFDLPDAYAAIMLRPTKSLTVYLQQAGRVLRMTDDKHKCIIIDHVNNTKYFGPPWIQRYWSLEGYGERTKKDSLTGLNLKLCTTCGNYLKTSVIICPYCGHVFKVKSRPVQIVLEQLEKITIESAKALVEKTVQKILNKEKYKMLKTLEDFKAYYAEQGWKEENAIKAYEKRQAENKIYWEGTREELIVMFSQRKNVTDPIAETEKALAARQAKNNGVFETGTLDEIVAELTKNPKYAHITNKEVYGQGILRKRLGPVLEHGTEGQQSQAKEIVEGEDTYTKMVKFAKTGKLTPMNENSPRIYTDEEADKFAKNKVKKDNRHIVDTGTKEQLIDLARQMHIAEDRRSNWADAVIKGRTTSVPA